MTKRQLIDEIRTLNRTAKPSFLAEFDCGELDAYLGHLKVARTPRPHGNPQRYQKYFKNRTRPAAPPPARAVAEAERESDDEGEEVDGDFDPPGGGRQVQPGPRDNPADALLVPTMAVAALAENPEDESPFAALQDGSEGWLF